MIESSVMAWRGKFVCLEEFPRHSPRRVFERLVIFCEMKQDLLCRSSLNDEGRLGQKNRSVDT